MNAYGGSCLEELNRPVLEIHPGGYLAPVRKTTRTYGAAIAAIRRTAQRMPEFTWRDVPATGANVPRLMLKLVQRGELVCVQRGRPGRFGHRASRFARANGGSISPRPSAEARPAAHAAHAEREKKGARTSR